MENQSTTWLLSEIDADDLYKTSNELLKPWAYKLSAAILLLIGFFGFSLNLFVIVLMCKDLKLWTPINVILFNLVCSDFSVAILGNPWTLTAALWHTWIFGKLLCAIYGFFMSLLGINSITTLTFLAYERYWLVTHTLTSGHLTKRKAIVAVVFIWTYSLLITTPPLFGWSSYVIEGANISCSVNWESKNFNNTSYIIFLFIFGLLIPLIIITFSYINILIVMKRNSIRLGRKTRAERRVTIMVGIMISAFLFAWTPYACFALIEQFGPKDSISPATAILPALLAKSSICYNPIIYVGLNTQFHSSWHKNITNDTMVIETTVNQVSQSRSYASFDCLAKETNNFKPSTNLKEHKNTQF